MQRWFAHFHLRWQLVCSATFKGYLLSSELSKLNSNWVSQKVMPNSFRRVLAVRLWAAQFLSRVRAAVFALAGDAYLSGNWCG